MPRIFSDAFIHKTLASFCVCVLFLFLFPYTVQSVTPDSVTIQWAANQESDLAGYRIYHGTAPGIYGLPQNIGKTTTYQYPNLESNKTHFFTVTAYDTSGNESLPSPEVRKYIAGAYTISLTSLTVSNIMVTSGKPYIFRASGLQTGNKVYIDRSYTFTTVPAAMQGAMYIQTANDDKIFNNAAFLSFTVNQPVTVYVAHDVRIKPKPSWLTTFTDTGETLVTTDATLHLFAQSFAAGTITLGGNAGGGGFSMYAVIIQPLAGGGPSPDLTPPTVALMAPKNGASVSGTVTVSATAQDNIDVVGVQFRLNGKTLGGEDTTKPFSLSWDTTTGPNASYTITATVRDAAGNTTTSSPHTVTVSNPSLVPPSLTISNLTVASGKPYAVPASGLQAGSKVYIDRSYTFTSVPAAMQGGMYIQTANDDKTVTSGAFLSFTVNQPVTVYVAHDTRAPKPAWLSTFSDTSQDVVTSDATLRLFARSFAAGPLTLGGNASGGGFSMYAVIVQPLAGR